MEKQSAGIFRPTAYGKTTQNHDIPIKQKGCEKFVRKSEKGVDKAGLGWYYIQAVRRESDRDNR